MASSVAIRQSYRRYLSPCHLHQKAAALSTTVTTHPSVEHNHQRSLSPLARRGRSSVRPPSGLQLQQHQENHILSNHYLHKYDKDEMTKAEVVHNLKTSAPVLNETKDRSNYLDLTSIMRIIGMLHIDLLKMFTWRQNQNSSSNMLPGMTKDDLYLRNPSHNAGDLKKQGTSQKMQTEKADKTIAKESRSRKAEIAHKQTENINREQLSFSEAVEKESSSVKTYYSKEVQDADLLSSSHQQSKTTKPKVTQQTTKSPAARSSQGTMETTTNIVKQITSFLPGFSSQKQPEMQQKIAEQRPAKKVISQKGNMPRSVVDRKTRGLVKALTVAKSTASKYVRLEDFCSHLVAYPEAKTLAVREKVIPCLLRLRASTDTALREQAMEALALVGYIDPVKGRGIRILSLDGGGTRGLVAVEILRKLEENCNKQIYELFDYVCGVSTGSLIGIMLAEYKLPLDEVERLYKTFSSEMFNRYKLMGMGKLVVSHSYYDAQLWEKILKENIGRKTFLESVKDPKTPKISAVSTLMNMTKLSNYVFRNYTHPSGAQTLYPGSCKYAFWQAVRASSAAPGYYQEYKIDEWIHQDGGLINNNPTGVAIHEARLLWPNDPIQCVVSLGTGRYEPSLEPELTSSGLRNKVNKFIQSATDTEAVHTVLNDLLPPSTYYRFNPYMSEDFLLDEIRPDRWTQMQLDTQMYCRKNRYKLQKASDQLLLTKLPHQKVADWVKLKKNLFFS